MGKNEQQAAPTAAPSVAVRVKVIKNGLLIGGGVAAAGTEVSVTAEHASYHEERGEVQILGTV